MAVQKKATLGTLVDKWQKKTDEKAALAKKLKDLTSEAFKLECELIEAMDEQDTLVVSGRGKKAKITESEVASIDDIDTLNKFIKRTGNFQLYERRISQVAFRELAEARKGKGIPGLKEFTKRKLSLTKL